MTVKIETHEVLPSCDLNKVNVDGVYLLTDSNTYTNSPIGKVNAHFTVTTYGAGNQQIEQTLTDRSNGYVYKRILYNSTAHVAPQGNISVSVVWYLLHGVGKGYSANFLSDADNTRNIGSANNTWSNIYTKNAVTVTSDRNAKNSIQEIDDKVLQAWSEVEPKQYKLNGDDNWSFGYIAQDIVEAFTRHGLDYKQYNIVHEEDGKFMLKYDMCAVLESALNRKRPL